MEGGAWHRKNVSIGDVGDGLNTWNLTAVLPNFYHCDSSWLCAVILKAEALNKCLYSKFCVLVGALRGQLIFHQTPVTLL